jgi:hypothetical protein
MTAVQSAKATITGATAEEVAKVLDALSALALDLSCHCDVPPDTLILSARRTREACDAIDEAVKALKTILQISAAAGGGPIPGAVQDQLDNMEGRA